MSDIETAKQIYFARCDAATVLPERFTEEEVWDLMVRAIAAERDRCAGVAFSSYANKTALCSKIIRRIRSGEGLVR